MELVTMVNTIVNKKIYLCKNSKQYFLNYVNEVNKNHILHSDLI